MEVEMVARAQRYALAFLNVFYSKNISEILIDRLESLVLFLDERGFFFPICSSSAVSKDDRIRLVKILIKKFDLKSSEEKLINVLIERGGASIVSLVFKQVVAEARKRRFEELCEVVSSHELDKKEQVQVIKTISESLGLRLIPHFLVDSSLISGIKVRGETFFWEKSVARRFLQMERSVERGSYYS
jgi:F0F1-type ATP synthase delta subunit